MIRYPPRSTTALVVREARARPVLRSARDVALRILDHRFGPAETRIDTPDSLLDFQREAVERARVILARRGGVLVADSVGLGKTHIALALVQPGVDAGGRALVIGPASLRHHWWAATHGSPGIAWISYARLSRGGGTDADFDYVVLDEAHALRNPATRRHRAAAALCRRSRVVLLTATPVNNSVWDLYHQLRLFAGDGDFRDVGVASLHSAFEEAESAAMLGSAASLQPVLRSVMIRRTRPFLRERAAMAGRESDLVFPRQAPPVAVRYAMPAPDASDAFTALGQLILDLDFPGHEDPNGRASSALLRIGLLKRLESSAHALRCSVEAYDSFLRRCLDGLEQGVLIRARDETRGDASGAQLRLDALLFATLPASLDVDAHRAPLDRERALLRRVRELLDHALSDDRKADALLTLLRGSLRSRRVIVFTQFRDTADYLHSRLRRVARVGLVSGAVARLGAQVADRRAVIRRFAPRANGAPLPSASDAVDVLIATDVLSEGINLQDADVVISYDLPWNPVRLIQRIGRVDRLGSVHAVVASYHFLPGDLERYLRLLERIARKSAAIDASVGSDMPALHAELLRSLDRDASSTVARIERDDADWFEIDERLLAARRGTAHAKALPGPADSIDRPRAGEELPVGILGTSAGLAPSGLVAAVVGSRFEWVAVRAGIVVQDERVCARMIEAALADPAIGPAGAVPSADVEALLAAARPVIARRAAAVATAALLPARGEAARIGRTLLSLAAALPGGPDAPTCVRIERGLERLATLPASTQACVGEERDSGPDRAHRLDRLLGRIEGFAGASSNGPSASELERPSGGPHARSETDVRLVGVLLERRAGVD